MEVSVGLLTYFYTILTSKEGLNLFNKKLLFMVAAARDVFYSILFILFLFFKGLTKERVLRSMSGGRSRGRGRSRTLDGGLSTQLPLRDEFHAGNSSATSLWEGTFHRQEGNLPDSLLCTRGPRTQCSL